MIKAYSQRITNPYSGYYQIVESDLARAVSMDGDMWEFHFLRNIPVKETPVIAQPRTKSFLAQVFDFFKGSSEKQAASNSAQQSIKKTQKVFARVGQINQSNFEKIITEQANATDKRIIELIRFLADTSLPFAANDHYEYWLLDAKDESPIALIYSCSNIEEQANFKQHAEWISLPAAMMPIENTAQETQNKLPPVNYRFERLVAERAGTYPKAKWFNRQEEKTQVFPPFLVTEDWDDEQQNDLCQRYLARLSPWLLMLNQLDDRERQRMEQAAKSNALEVAKYHALYPNVSDKKIMASILVEAKLRESNGEKVHSVKYRWS